MNRTVHVEHCMGTAVTIDIRDRGEWRQAIDEVVRWLHHVDSVFSAYKTDSDISRIQRGELKVDAADPDVRVVLDLCVQVQATTDYHFTALPQGRIDPTGLVKGWAIERASRLLRARGSANHAINGGGDVQLAGEAEPGRPWAVGISEPADRMRVATVVTGRDIAVATSGTGERGAHIVNPRTGKPAQELGSATVIGPSLTFADAYATAAFVMGRRALHWIAGIDDYEALLIDADGRVSHSAGWRAAVSGVGTAWRVGTPTSPPSPRSAMPEWSMRSGCACWPRQPVDAPGTGRVVARSPAAPTSAADGSETPT